MGEWKRVKLGSLIRIKHGYAFPGAGITSDDNGKVLVTPGNFNIGGGFKESGKKFFSGEFPAAYCLSGGDLIVTMTDLSKSSDTLGYSAIVPSNSDNQYLHNQRIGLVGIVDEMANRNFIYWLMRTPSYHHEVVAGASGTTVKHTSPSRIYDVEVELPDLPTQRRIAAVLGALDDKIEVNRKICENLEAQAQALFKAWFVDFEPFGGKRPEGWKMGKLGDVVEFKNGFAFKSSEFKERARYKVMTIKAVQNGKLVTEGADCIDDIPTKMPSWCVLRDADILLSLTGNVARCCLVYEDDLLLNQRVARLVPRTAEDIAFVYALFRSDKTRKRLETIAKGTAQANLSPIETADLPQLIPAEAERSRFANLCNPMIEAIVKTNRESRALAAMRDALLPKLMSGELSVEKVA